MEMDSEEFQLESCPFLVEGQTQNINSSSSSAHRKSQKRPDISDSDTEDHLDLDPVLRSNNNCSKRLKFGDNPPSAPVVVDPYDLGLVDDDFSDDEEGLPPVFPSAPKAKPVQIQTSKSPLSSSSGIRITPSSISNARNNGSKSARIPTRSSAPAPPPPKFVCNYRRVLRVIPTSIPYVPVTNSDGSRLYLRLLPESNPISLEPPDPNEETRVLTDREITDSRKSNRTLLGLNFEHLKKEAREIKDKFHSKIDQILGNNLDILSSLPEAVSGAGTNRTPQTQQLFVDKYKPRGYMDLLSEETVNRSLMHWLKLWDNFVFGQDYLSKHKELRDRYATLETKENESKFAWLSKKLVEDESYDETGRPIQKVALLYGPAGLGKTTAAHVIARHTGYSVIEMNASDDRSVDAFTKTLIQTTESKSEMFQDGRPNCLIIDEIDGAPAATVEVLVNLISGKAKETGKNKGKKSKILRRPIICICNDLFVPSLKNLRTSSTLILQFNPISVPSLVERIEEISLKENLQIDTGTLNVLAEKSDCDIRSCLSSLQFIKRYKNTENSNSNSFGGVNSNASFLNSIGNQNKSKGIFRIWEEIFMLPQSKKYYFNTTEDPTRTDVRFRNVLKSVSNFGDYPKILSGVFENYLGLKFRDSYFQSILDTLEWTIWFDQITNEINQSQNYAGMGFLPVYFVLIHFLLASRTPGKLNLKYPTNSVFLRSTQHMNNFKAQLDGIPPTVGRFITMRDGIMDIFPNLVGIIQPLTIRAIPSQLWSPRERETIQNIVAIMIGYHLTYLQIRNPTDGSYGYQLEPNIEDLVKFNIEESLFKKQNFPYSIKQLIGREVEMEKLRMNEESEQSSGKILSSKIVEKKPTKVPLPATHQKLEINQPKPLPNSGIGNIIPKDFFGRPIIPKVDPKDTSGKAGSGGSNGQRSDIWFRFKEGYSNAVRKTLKLKDLL